MSDEHDATAETPRGKDRRGEQTVPYTGEERRKGDRRKTTSSYSFLATRPHFDH